ncbi:MAG: DUF1990 domain-containing protein [Planctomycetota bacterium]|nr:MAG: DUF1990 domain-containing protein [Planctomycetota bacterium]REJ90144.1 MAG: DUF1990 domain-containing protein [Planctomycetota bacterium]REK30710.1 MAG: DUF1990 domain-containing protein [Planctomycetota bacterium]REK33085.1 MAG: DUF1990 domain-containing protein [Planctomycetota bacterium]
MYLLKKPTDERISAFIEAQSSLEFTYPSVGATRNAESPPGFVVDHNRICLGSGRAVFDASCEALKGWQHYRFDWVDLHRPDAEPQPGQTVGVLAHALGIWVLNACRIVYVLDEEQPLRRFAFAYGTLPEHAESGEERFQVEWRADDDTVWYDILAFSRPHQWPARISYPYVRRKQKQFARESKQVMHAAVTNAASP